MSKKNNKFNIFKTLFQFKRVHLTDYRFTRNTRMDFETIGRLRPSRYSDYGGHAPTIDMEIPFADTVLRLSLACDALESSEFSDPRQLVDALMKNEIEVCFRRKNGKTPTRQVPNQVFRDPFGF
jgi:hypothetical protein